jgi:hypothetical protein
LDEVILVFTRLKANIRDKESCIVVFEQSWTIGLIKIVLYNFRVTVILALKRKSYFIPP